jgi:hypothetical protein
MRKVFIALILLILLLQYSWAEEQTEATKIGPTCTFGNLSELSQFFAKQNLMQIAKGTRRNKHNQSQDNIEVQFLLAKDMTYFHVATIKPEYADQYRACIISSAREVDLHVDPPVESFLQRIPREHLLFLNDVPTAGECPTDKNNCAPWSGPAELNGIEYLITAYLYSEHWQLDAYTQIVDIKIDKKVIQPTRGMLAEFARLKYASRLRNEFNEDATQLEAAKQAYRNIYTEVDHEHPLYMFIIGEDDTWQIKMLDRHRGIVWTPIQGDNLVMFPLSHFEYNQLPDNEPIDKH